MPWFRTLLLIGAPFLMGATLPGTGPVPIEKPAERAEPAPEIKAPEAGAPNAQAPGAGTLAPPAPTGPEPPEAAKVPKPLPKPAQDTSTPPATDDGPKPDGKEEEEDKATAPPPPPPPPLVKENPEELKACLAELTSLGAKFQPIDPIDDGNGCGIEHPIEVTEVLPDIGLGRAPMRCKTALTLAHWLKDTVQPAMNIAMPGRKIVGIVPGSTYACRLRNGASTGKISEHARGNAFDVAAFKLDNGKTMEMKPRDEDSTLEGAFQRTATAGACLHFTTVLSPGSDAAHETHLHLDIMERTNGYRYCR
ncbi:extensin family protein [Neorhizobium sp. DT-125]|uniref:extensin-like domain-containing protein n=1 Tax=Neorhizobium sp. DT-125 TaxID=3396163 RepID=UPI003F1D31B2